MITIKPTLWKRSVVISFILLGAFCLCPLVLGSPTATYSIMGVGTFVVMFLLYWFTTRLVRLEITETEVRAEEGGWSRAPLGKKEAFRSEICSIHYVPKRYTFRGADGQSLMAISNTWTMPDMVKAAEVLRVPLYDDRAVRAKGKGVNRARLVYDPATGPMTAGDGR
jgi:hypothetical protein